jgi:hypothetical protein
MVTGTGNTMDLNGQLKIEGYGTYPFKVDGASNTISDLYVYDNGYNAAGICYTIYLNANSDLIRPVIASGLDNGTRHYGYYLDNCPSGSVTDAVIQNVAVTGAGTRVYALSFLADNGGITVDGLTVENCSAVHVFGAIWQGTNADDVGVLRRFVMRDCTATANVYGAYVLDRGMDMENFIMDSISAPTSRATYVKVTGAFPGGNNRVVSGAIYDVETYGIYAETSFAGSQLTVHNVIVDSATVRAFQSSGTIAPDSDYNTGHNNGDDYSVAWIEGANDWSTTDPEFTDPANEDFTLQSTSPCIDTGLWITGRTSDIAGQPISGNGQDRGAYEFQQIGGRNKRTEISQPPIIQTRSQRSLR